MKMVAALRNEFGGHAVTGLDGKHAAEHRSPGS